MESIPVSAARRRRNAAQPAFPIREFVPASSTAVMWEQMEYLLSHTRSGCPVECPDCSRLAKVKTHLLQPFA